MTLDNTTTEVPIGLPDNPTPENTLTGLNPNEQGEQGRNLDEGAKQIIGLIEENEPDKALLLIAKTDETAQNQAHGTGQETQNTRAQENLKKISQKEAMTRIMQQREQRYLENSPEDRRQGLRQRYEDERCQKDAVQSEITQFAKDRGVDLQSIPDELADLLFGADTENLTEKAMLRIVDQFFLNEQASYNPEKRALVQAQTKEYMRLLRQAQLEGAVPKDVKAADIYRLVSENIAMLAWQDRAASENLLGDHGVRHILGYNINASMQLAEELERRGASITAMDKLLIHQIMIYHDIGYALAPVREAINTEGIRGQDAGHNVLGARYARERIADDSDVWQTVFGQNQENLDILHRGILYHDKDENGKPGINFIITPENNQDTNQARLTNIESIIRTADNTHAFEDKLPELLYRIPETLKFMRLMKTAAEIGDITTFLEFRRELAKKIKNNPNLSKDDKDALILAVMGKNNESGNDQKKGLQANGYKFTVARICGNKPQFSVDDQGRLVITVQESAIHHETVGLFGQESYDQLRKFLADLQGSDKKDINLDVSEIIAGSLVIRLQTGEQKATDLTDYQQKINEMREADPAFVEFANRDIALSLEQLALEKSCQLFSDGKIDEARLQQLIASFITASEPEADMVRLAQERITAIKDERKKLLEQYRNRAL